MIIGWYSANWYLEVDDEISCNRTEMEIAVYGHLTTEVQFFSNKLYEKLDYGTVRKHFLSKNAKKLILK